MSIVNEIKCARCDRKYSGVRSRCPYCGARRIGRGKYSEDSDNAKGKMLISVLIMAVFTVGAAVLLFSADPGDGRASAGSETVIPNPEEGVESIPSITVAPTPSPTPPPVLETPGPPAVETVVLQFDNRRMRDDISQPLRSGELPINIRVEPIGSENNMSIVWSSSDPAIFEVVEVPGTNRLGAKIVPISTGSARLTVTVGDVESQTVIVRIT